MMTEPFFAKSLRTQGLMALVALLVGFSVLQAFPSHAGTYASSKSPYWKVGSLDETLSKACRRGLFNQTLAHEYNILFIGPDGRTITGIAKKGWNLKDPKGLATQGRTFHFYNDGYSDCRVYVAGQG